jgi:radical SAM protein with 4Fe4S-binding SPASM domain
LPHADRMRLPPPRFIQFYPTFRCNQKCSFCFNGPSQNAEMSFTSALRLIGILSRNGIGELDVMGGEPLLLDWMPDFAEAALAQGLSLNLSTNGSDPERIGRLRGLPGKKNISIGVSLEGSTQEKHRRLTASGHFSALLESIAALTSAGFSPVVKTVVSRETMDDIPAIADLLKKKGIHRYYLIHMDLLSDSRSMRSAATGYPEFLAFYEAVRVANPDISVLRVNASCFEKNTLPAGMRCAGGVRKLAVMPDGSVYPCNLFHRVESFRLGNIFETDIPAIWRHPRLDLFRRRVRNSCAVTGCTNRASCTGGCPAHGYFHYGKPSATDPRCCL